MGLLNGQTVQQGDFVSTPSGASDEGKVAKLNPSGKLPAGFMAGWELLNSFTYSSGSPTEIVLADLGGYDSLLIIVAGINVSTLAQRLLRVSTNNGSSFVATGYKYASINVTEIVAATTTTAGLWEHVIIERANKSGLKIWSQSATFDSERHMGGVIDVTDPINAIRLFSAAGHFTGGNLYVYGKN